MFAEARVFFNGFSARPRSSGGAAEPPVRANPIMHGTARQGISANGKWCLSILVRRKN